MKLYKFEVNIERDKEKEVEHNISRLFLQLTQVLMSRINIVLLHSRIHELDNAMASDLKCVNTWLNAIKLTLNISKTEYMLITLKQKHNHLPYIPSPSINGAFIKKVSVVKSLGCLLMEISLGIPMLTKFQRRLLLVLVR